MSLILSPYSSPQSMNHWFRSSSGGRLAPTRSLTNFLLSLWSVCSVVVDEPIDPPEVLQRPLARRHLPDVRGQPFRLLGPPLLARSARYVRLVIVSVQAASQQPSNRAECSHLVASHDIIHYIVRIHSRAALARLYIAPWPGWAGRLRRRVARSQRFAKTPKPRSSPYRGTSVA